ncbi:DUF305 domain-containing protein [Nocardioides sp. L-11A]|uniref:DUF305 domain-containing protein n=1 Tax=Nocardioides sp. L-11A TaxID=3043848 RepID=UPI00249A3E43|nr:DUF305 domain-containing protein [Nocardioides sp. L-11A]
MKRRTAAPAALALTATLILAGCSSEDDPMPGMDHGSSERSADDPTGQADTPDATDANDADVMFASMMIVHHEQAIEMSDIVLGQAGVDPAVVELAEAVKAAQGPEIEQLRGWLVAWGADPDGQGMAGMDHGDGMMSEDDLAALETAGGAEASRLFLEQMIVHHEGAVAMARTEVADGRNPDAVRLARTIIDAQTAEIQEMNDLLDAR